jgi:hypothetical protein
MDPTGKKIVYASDKAKESYQFLEKTIYKDLAEDPDQIYEISTFEDIGCPDKGAGCVFVEGMDPNSNIIPITFNAGYFETFNSEELLEATAVHERYHAKHLKQFLKEGKRDFTRYSDLWGYLDYDLEEAITNYQTIEYFLSKNRLDMAEREFGMLIYGTYGYDEIINKNAYYSARYGVNMLERLKEFDKEMKPYLERANRAIEIYKGYTDIDFHRRDYK